jgi:hypothetical protein
MEGPVCTVIQRLRYGQNNRVSMGELLSFLISFLVNSDCRFHAQADRLCTQVIFSSQNTHGPAIIRSLITCFILCSEHSSVTAKRTTTETVSLCACSFSRAVWPIRECVQRIILKRKLWRNNRGFWLYLVWMTNAPYYNYLHVVKCVM